MEGWIKIHRKFLDWQWFKKPEAVQLFIYMLLKANHKDGNWQGHEIKKGQFITSAQTISNDTKLSLQVVRTLLKKFELTNEIIVKSTNKFTMLTICKYECYQDESNTTNKQLTNKQQTTNKQLTTNKNEKNNKENIYREFQHLFITEDEVKKLLDKHTITQINNVLNDIENYKQNTKYKSLYLTAVKWLQKNEPTSEGISPEEIKARKYGLIK
jgi:23S rRNA A1618 N6-methylase RlmF